MKEEDLYLQDLDEIHLHAQKDGFHFKSIIFVDFIYILDVVIVEQEPLFFQASMSPLCIVQTPSYCGENNSKFFLLLLTKL